MESHRDLTSATHVLPGRRAFFVARSWAFFLLTKNQHRLRDPIGFLPILLMALTVTASQAASTSPDTRWQTVALKPFVQEPFKPAWMGSPWSGFPHGSQTWDGIPFQTDGLVRVAGLAAIRRGDWRPSEVLGIPIEKSVPGVAVLHGLEDEVPRGTPVFSLVFHYTDGSEQSVRFSTGVQTSSGESVPGVAGLTDPQSKQIWPPPTTNAHSSAVAVFLTHVPNPKPQLIVSHLDLLSLFSEATPVVFGMTLDTAPADPAAAKPVRASHLAKKLAKIADTDVRRPLTARAVDAVTHQALTNAEFFLSFGTDEHTAFLDQKHANTSGTALFHYPPSETVERVVFARAPGYVSAMVRDSHSTQPQLKDSVIFELKPGQRIGGLVKNGGGEPVNHAQVTITSLSVKKGRDFFRADCETVFTGPDGRWSSSVAPENLKGYQFQVRHPAYRSASYRVLDESAAPTAGSDRPTESRTGVELQTRTLTPPASSPANASKSKIARTTSSTPARNNTPVPRMPTWTSEDLKKGEALVALKSSERILGTVESPEGKPVEGVFVGAWPENKKMVLTDRQGRFELTQDELGPDGRIYVFSERYAPMTFDYEEGNAKSANPLRFTLSAPKTLVGVIEDSNGGSVEGAQVRVTSWNGSPGITWSGTTDAQGKFYWTNAAPGQLGIRLDANNFQRTDYNLEWTGGAELKMRIQRQSTFQGLVRDADTGKPVPEFTAIRGYAYNRGESLRWQRGNAIKGRNGIFTGAIYNYGTDSRQSFMIEAPGYFPTLSAEVKSGTWTTNEIKLKRGTGIHGIVQLPDGTPARNASLAMVEGDEWVFIEKNGQMTRSSSYTEQVRCDAQGRFQFQPHFPNVRIVAAATAGIADVTGTEVEKTAVVQLRPWGRIEGTFRLASNLRSNQVIKLETFRKQQTDSTESRESAVWVNLRTMPDTNGHFVFEQAPPGTRKVFIETRLPEHRNYGSRTGVSHEVLVDLAPGATATVTLGGGGRHVVGKMNVLGGDPEDVDWLWDAHTLGLNVPQPKGYPSFTFSGQQSQTDMELMQEKYRTNMVAFMKTPEGDRYERAQRHYMLQFDTNGVFSIDNVPPGDYMLNIAPMEKPGDSDSYSYRQLGQLNRMVKVPSSPKENALLDLGSLDIQIRSSLRIGKKAPAFEFKTLDNKTLNSEMLAGKIVLIYFWMNWESSSYDIGVIGELLAAHEEDKRLVVVLPTAIGKLQLTVLQKLHKFPAPIALLEDWNTDKNVLGFAIQSWPSAVLIDTDGRIAGLQLRGNGLRSSITRVLSKAATAKAADSTR